MRGSLRWETRLGGGSARWPSRWFDSETTRILFSNIFQSLIVLSVCGISQECWEGQKWRTVGRKQEVGGILSSTPLDLVDLLLDFKRLQIIEFGLV
jgi:hypothetical protein